ELHKAGFGSYTESGFQSIALYLPSEAGSPKLFSEPVRFPPPDSAVPLAIYETGEWPDPLTGCDAYTAPTGLPVTLQLGHWVPIQVSAHSFTHEGQQLQHCVFDATTYSNPDQATERWGRRVLEGSSAV